MIPIDIGQENFSLKEHKGIQLNGAKASIYPSGVIKPDPPYILITEGEFKALKLIQEGFPAVCGTAGASVWKEEWNDLFRGLTVVIAYDADDAGKAGARKVAENLKGKAKSVKIIQWPDYMDSPEKKDPTDFFVTLGKGKEDFQALIGQAKEYEPEKESDEKETITVNGATFKLPRLFVEKGGALYKKKCR